MKSSRPKKWTSTHHRVPLPEPEAEAKGPPASRPKPPKNGLAPSIRDLSRDDIDVVFQPILELATHSIFAYEALVRCKWPEYANPTVLFELASAEGACGRLGRLIREVTFERGAGYPLFVNVHPDELSARWLVRPDDPIYMHDHNVFVEVTESAAFTHYEVCRGTLGEMTARGGVFLAVDDLGAGHSNLKRVLELEPHVVKLDRALITDLDSSRRQQIMVRHMVQMFGELGATVVAEGVETIDEFKAIVDVGVQYGQGYLFAKPMYPLPKAQWPGARSVPPETAHTAKVNFSLRPR
jgi:EAL domain-containing protein (putative c-di-GMP-specific phosphodiesterase class I)